MRFWAGFAYGRRRAIGDVPLAQEPEREETKQQPTKGGDRLQERCHCEGQLEDWNYGIVE
jgi:hypothetical protein